jgi:hypothetical protein
VVSSWRVASSRQRMPWQPDPRRASAAAGRCGAGGVRSRCRSAAPFIQLTPESCTDRFGDSTSEATMRPNPRCHPRLARGGGGGRPRHPARSPSGAMTPHPCRRPLSPQRRGGCAWALSCCRFGKTITESARKYGTTWLSCAVLTSEVTIRSNPRLSMGGMGMDPLMLGPVALSTTAAHSMPRLSPSLPANHRHRYRHHPLPDGLHAASAARHPFVGAAIPSISMRHPASVQMPPPARSGLLAAPDQTARRFGQDGGKQARTRRRRRRHMQQKGKIHRVDPKFAS